MPLKPFRDTSGNLYESNGLWEKELGPIVNSFDNWTMDKPLSPEVAAKYGNKTTPDWLGKDLSESNPLPWQRYLDKGVEAMGSDILNNRVNGRFYENNLLYGIPDKAEKLDYSSVLGGSGNPQLDAIARKYQKQVGDSLNSLKGQANYDLGVMKAKETSRASDILGTAEKIRMSNFKEQWDYQQKRQQILDQQKNAQQAAEASTLGSILGLGGAVVGTVLGGPIGGALLGGAGSQA